MLAASGKWKRCVLGIAVVAFFLIMTMSPGGLVQPAQAANCSYDALVRSTSLQVTVYTAQGQLLTFAWGAIEIWAHYTQVRFNCVDYYHYLKVHSPSASQEWSLLAPVSGWVYGWWTLQLPSWSTIASVGSFPYQSCTQYQGVTAGGAGTSSVTHEVLGMNQGCWPYQTWDTADLEGFQSNIWHSNQYGLPYQVTFTLRYRTNSGSIDLSGFGYTTITS